MHNRGIAANWYAILGGRVGCKEEETRIEVDRKDGRLPWLCPGMTGRIPCIPRGHGHISHSSRFPSRQQPCVLPPPPFLFDQRHHYLSYILPFSFFFFNSIIFYSAIKSFLRLFTHVFVQLWWGESFWNGCTIDSIVWYFYIIFLLLFENSLVRR